MWRIYDRVQDMKTYQRNIVMDSQAQSLTFHHEARELLLALMASSLYNDQAYKLSQQILPKKQRTASVMNPASASSVSPNTASTLTSAARFSRSRALRVSLVSPPTQRRSVMGKAQPIHTASSPRAIGSRYVYSLLLCV